MTFVQPDPLLKVQRSLHSAPITQSHGYLLRILPDVIGGGNFDVEDIAHDQLFVAADTLDKHQLNADLLTLVCDPLASLPGGIGGIEHRDHAILLTEPLEDIVEGLLRSLLAEAGSLGVAGVEEGGGGVLVACSSPVVADIERLCGDAEPRQVLAHCTRNVSTVFHIRCGASVMTEMQERYLSGQYKSFRVQAGHTCRRAIASH
jgi:hypothetical protein